jgi:DNA-binding transcriptional ArsR family regulator
MPVAAIEEPRPVQRVRFCPSAASELFWLLLYLMRAKRLPEDHPAALLAARHPDLRERIVSFWDDGGEGGYTELFVLAQRSGTLLHSDPDAFLGRLDAAAEAPDAPLGLESETPEEVEAVRARLQRLRDDPELRARYRQLLVDAWATVAETWESTGAPAVEAALRQWPSRIERSSSVLAALPRGHITHKYLPLLEAAERRGEIVITPLYFAGMGHLIELPGMLLIGVGVVERDRLAQRRASAEAMVNRLKVLTDPTRVLIVMLLSSQAMSIGDLVEELGLSQPTISVHVRQLRDAGLLDVRRDGGRTLYATTLERVDALLDDARRELRSICEP